MQTDIYNYLPPYWASLQRGYFIAAMVASIIIFISTCLIYEDNDAKCWYLVIPFYNLYTKFKIFWNKSYFYFHLIPFIVAFISLLAAGVMCLSLAFSSMGGIGYGAAEQVAASVAVIIVAGVLVCLICLTIMGIFEIILENHVSKTYDYDGLFTVGLILLPIIFYAILGIKCIKAGVLRRIPTGRKVFMIVCVVLMIALTVLPVYFKLF